VATNPHFVSSGDLVADRRYKWAIDHAARGDVSAAADILVQVVERVPDFAPAWFALGAVRDILGNRDGAVAAFEEALRADAEDAQGAGLRLARLGAVATNPTMSTAYIRRLFDQYADTFDKALTEDLAYRAPALLFDAVRDECRAAGRPMQFAAMLDLGCGTGLAGLAFRPAVDRLVGVDLSPTMIRQAEAKGVYDLLELDDMFEFMAIEGYGAYDLVVAADVFGYLGELGRVTTEVGRILARGGCFAFVVETHNGSGSVLCETLRFAHAPAHVEESLGNAGLKSLRLDKVSFRRERGRPIDSLLAIGIRAS
jgi:predicted TPR repeat methyltransferase